jgi:hypothetical protein
LGKAGAVIKGRERPKDEKLRYVVSRGEPLPDMVNSVDVERRWRREVLTSSEGRGARPKVGFQIEKERGRGQLCGVWVGLSSWLKAGQMFGIS